MNRALFASAACAALVLGAVACSSVTVDEAAESTTERLDEPTEIAFFQTVRGRIDANQSVTYAFHGERGWAVDVLAATPDQKLAWSAPSVVVVDESTGATLFDHAEGLPVQGRSGHTVGLPSTGRYLVTLAPAYAGQPDEAFSLEIEAQIPCGPGGVRSACPASLSCQSGQCWPADLGPQRCDASGAGTGCVPAGHSECDVDPRQMCLPNSFICGRTGGTETPQSCLGSGAGLCCRK